MMRWSLRPYDGSYAAVAGAWWQALEALTKARAQGLARLRCYVAAAGQASWPLALQLLEGVKGDEKFIKAAVEVRVQALAFGSLWSIALAQQVKQPLAVATRRALIEAYGYENSWQEVPQMRSSPLVYHPSSWAPIRGATATRCRSSTECGDLCGRASGSTALWPQGLGERAG